MRTGDRPDLLLILSIAAALCIGLLTIYSTAEAMAGTAIFERQLLWCVFGLLAMVVGIRISMRMLDELAPYLYGFSCLLLLFTVFLGSGPAGRWIVLDPFRFQPAELTKATLIIVVAKALADLRRKPRRGGEIYVLLIATPAVLLTWLQPDLGTAAALCLVVLAMFLWAGYGPGWIFLLVSPLLAAISSSSLILWIAFTVVLVLVLLRKRLAFSRWVILLGGNTLVAALTPLAWNLLKPYQQARITTFLNPAVDPHGAGWNIIQSEVAVGSGGMFGQGFLHGAQKELAFLPSRHTDFVFSVWAEEMGFVGGVLLLLLFWVIVWRITVTARKTVNPFSSFLVAGVAASFAVHVFVNVGMSLGIMPVTGLPLLLVSYGGSHLVTTLFLLGIALRAGMSWRVM
ncbi:rod shape-determining protein RodA [Candidatus Fermentibacteria bacterium]|nr:rod shape-determining protein RodA [Candidatus Fermentibacteria bacterium]